MTELFLFFFHIICRNFNSCFEILFSINPKGNENLSVQIIQWSQQGLRNISRTPVRRVLLMFLCLLEQTKYFAWLGSHNLIYMYWQSVLHLTVICFRIIDKTVLDYILIYSKEVRLLPKRLTKNHLPNSSLCSLFLIFYSCYWGEFLSWKGEVSSLSTPKLL